MPPSRQPVQLRSTCPYCSRDRISAARGVALGIALGLVLWGVLILALYAVTELL